MVSTRGYHNNPDFHVDRTNAVGGVFEQTKTALQYIYIDDDDDYDDDD